MPYLVCKKCGRYYELQERESPEDFGMCQCGGKLRYVESIYGGPKRQDTPIIKLISNKYALIAIIMIFIAFLILATDYFAHPMEKMDNSIPNNVAGYYIPQSTGKIENQIGLDIEDHVKSVEYKDGPIKWVTKHYIKQGSPFMITVLMGYYADESPKEVESLYKTTLFGSVENIEIAGKNADGMDYSPYYLFSWYGKKYTLTVFIRSADPNSSNLHREEGIAFLKEFIPEFDKMNNFS